MLLMLPMLAMLRGNADDRGCRVGRVSAMRMSRPGLVSCGFRVGFLGFEGLVLPLRGDRD